jgi:probable phosphoglycerate mutase
MNKIYLVRHGQDEDNANGILNGHRDMPLTEIGKEQANTLAQKIKETGIHFDKVYSSPLQRAYITAETITNKLGLEKPEIRDLLIERDFGTMTGRVIKDAEQLCAPNTIKAENITYILCPEGAETFPQLIERGKEILKYIQEKHSNKNILLVSHGDIGKMIYAAYYHLAWKEVLTMFHFGNSEVLVLSQDTPQENTHLFKSQQYNP